MLAVATVLPLFDGRDTALGWWTAAVAVVVVMAAAWAYGDRHRELGWPGLAAALLTFPALLLLELADPQHATALAPMLIVPIAWCALYHGPRQLALAVALSGVALFLPILLIGDPGYPASTWRRGVLWLVVLGLIAPVIHVLVRSTSRIAWRLTASEQRYRVAFAQAPVAIAIIGAEGGERGLILQANRALHDLLDCVEGALLLRRIVDFAGPDDVDAIARELSVGGPGVPREMELQLTTLAGRRRWVSASLVLVRNAPGEPLRYVCHVEDITARRESEHALLDALEKQSHAATQLREVARTRADLVATVSHDVRTPLATISAYVQLLAAGEGGSLSTDQRAMLDVIEQNVRRADGITGELLAFGRFEHAATTEPSEPVAIGAVLDRVVRSIEPTAAARGQSVVLDSELAGTSVAGHAGQLDRVLANLLTNAVKFTPDNGRIRVRGRTVGGKVVIEVTDTGAGIPAGEQSKIFERFYRSDAGRRRRVAGTGLGLAIAREIAALHDGTIEVRSTPGRGSTFTLRLPALVDAPA